MKPLYPIVIFANPVFEGEGLASTVELAKEISKHQEVLFINFPMTYTQLLKGEGTSRMKRALGWKRRLYRPIEQLEKLWVLEMPYMLPSNKLKSERWYSKVLSRNNRTYRYHVLRALKKLNWSSTIAMNAFNPLYKEAFLSFSAIKYVYYCYDNIEAAYWMANHGVSLEQELASQVDEIYVSSKALWSKFSGYSTPITWIPNGMDPANFKRKTEFPEQAMHAAYIGALDNRLDYDLLNGLLQAFRNIQFTIVGPLKCSQAEALVGHERVHYQGIHPPNKVGEMLQHCDMGLIPFVKNEFTKYIYPLKINEYLSLGLAVLTTDFADLSFFEDWVRPISNLEEAQVELARLQTEESNMESANERIAFAQTQSWEARAQKMRTQLNG